MRAWRIVAGVAVVLPIAVALVLALRQPWFPAADNAVIELQTMDVPGHLPRFGVFSRYGFHHPGPALFLVYAVPQRLLGPSGLLVGAAAINALSVIGISVYLFRRGGRALLAMGTVAVLVFEHAFAEQLLEPWNSWVAVLPFALALVLAWSVWCEDWWALPILAAALSFIVQTHVGYALLAVWLFAGPAIVVARARQLRVLGVTAAVLTACWLLPVVDQFSGAGNLGLIADHFASSDDPVVGWSAGLSVLARELGITAPWLGGAEPVVPFTAGVEGTSALTLLPMFAVFALGVVVPWRNRAPSPLATDARRLQVVMVGTLVASFISLARITGEPYPYLIRWLWIVAIMVWLSALWSLWVAWRDRIVARLDAVGPPWLRGDGRVASMAWAGLVVLLLFALWSSVAAAVLPAPQPEFAAAIGALADPVADAAAGRGNLLVLGEGPSFQEVQSGLVPELERRGIVVMVPDSDAFKYGEHRKANGRRVDARLVVAVNQAVVDRRAAGSEPVAEYDPLSPLERAELENLTDKYLRQVAQQLRSEVPSDPMTPADIAKADGFNRRGHLVAVYFDPGPVPEIVPVASG